MMNAKKKDEETRLVYFKSPHFSKQRLRLLRNPNVNGCSFSSPASFHSQALKKETNGCIFWIFSLVWNSLNSNLRGRKNLWGHLGALLQFPSQFNVLRQRFRVVKWNPWSTAGWLFIVLSFNFIIITVKFTMSNHSFQYKQSSLFASLINHTSRWTAQDMGVLYHFGQGCDLWPLGRNFTTARWHVTRDMGQNSANPVTRHSLSVTQLTDSVVPKDLPRPLWLWPVTNGRFRPHPQAMWRVTAEQFEMVQYQGYGLWEVFGPQKLCTGYGLWDSLRSMS